MRVPLPLITGFVTPPLPPDMFLKASLRDERNKKKKKPLLVSFSFAFALDISRRVFGRPWLVWEGERGQEVPETSSPTKPGVRETRLREDLFVFYQSVSRTVLTASKSRKGVRREPM